MRHLIFSFVLAAIALGIAGCTSPPPPGTKISGKVTLDGAPIESGSLTFIDEKGNSQAFAVKQGKYMAYLSPGKKSVRFYAVKVVREYDTDEGKARDYESVIPAKYAKSDEFDFTVGDKSEVKDFALSP